MKFSPALGACLWGIQMPSKPGCRPYDSHATRCWKINETLLSRVICCAPSMHCGEGMIYRGTFIFYSSVTFWHFFLNGKRMEDTEIQPHSKTLTRVFCPSTDLVICTLIHPSGTHLFFLSTDYGSDTVLGTCTEAKTDVVLLLRVRSAARKS